MNELARDLADFVTVSPTPYHAVAEAVRRLSAAGFVEQSETAPWNDKPGGRYLVRDGTFVAWVQHAHAPQSRPQPLRVFLAHTDSPTLKVKPRPDTGRGGWRQVGVEVYGGALWNSWLDRDLGLAGRLVSYDGTTVLVDVARPLLRVPQLAIHLDRNVNQGLKLDAQQHLLPIWGLGAPAAGDLLEFVAAEAGVDAEDVAAHDLVLYDLTPPARLGEEEELLAAPRLDNLASVHAGITALCAATAEGVTPVVVGFDHEEIGSASATGAAGPLLEGLLTRLAGGFDARGPVFAASRCLSVDVTHAAHPNYLELHDPEHRTLPNQGPALKVNANQRYATDAPGAAAWYRACREADVPTQVFVSKNTVPCGSTVGPITATRLGIRTVDVGIPVLSMHSARELCGVADPGYLAAAATAYLSDPL